MTSARSLLEQVEPYKSRLRAGILPTAGRGSGCGCAAPGRFPNSRSSQGGSRAASLHRPWPAAPRQGPAPRQEPRAATQVAPRAEPGSLGRAAPGATSKKIPGCKAPVQHSPAARSGQGKQTRLEKQIIKKKKKKKRKKKKQTTKPRKPQTPTPAPELLGASHARCIPGRSPRGWLRGAAEGQPGGSGHPGEPRARGAPPSPGSEPGAKPRGTAGDPGGAAGTARGLPPGTLPRPRCSPGAPVPAPALTCGAWSRARPGLAPLPDRCRSAAASPGQLREGCGGGGAPRSGHAPYGRGFVFKSPPGAWLRVQVAPRGRGSVCK